NVYLDNVRVPSFHLIGVETAGWRVTQSALELEHGGEGGLTARRGWFHVDRMLEEWKSQPMHTVARGDRARGLFVDAHIRTHVGNLFVRRNYWMHQTHQRQSYEGVQGSWYERDTVLRVADAVQDLYGMHGMVRDPLWRVNSGHAEFAHRRALMSTHGAG